MKTKRKEYDTSREHQNSNLIRKIIRKLNKILPVKFDTAEVLIINTYYFLLQCCNNMLWAYFRN